MMSTGRDHGGGLDAAAARYGGAQHDWIDLSTGINPIPYPVPEITARAWTALPDTTAQDRLIDAARRFWQVPTGCGVLAASGASALIARLPALAPAGRVHIPAPTYNEHAAAFGAHGWAVLPEPEAEDIQAKVIVHPNNPTGHWYLKVDLRDGLMVIDESFADEAPDRSMIAQAAQPGVVVLKSFGKFWGLAGLRVGFAIARPETIERLSELVGPWPVSGPALQIAAGALEDAAWAEVTRTRLAQDAARLDGIMGRAGANAAGGTNLFRLYEVDDAAAWQARLASRQIWTRIFPYSSTMIRLGLPAPDQWNRLEAAL